MNKERWEYLKKLKPTIVRIIEPIMRPRYNVTHREPLYNKRAITRKKTRGDCLICQRPTRRFDNRKAKYVCARHS